ncbi:MAG: hypothetical protein IIB15_09185, partial [Chloroflexi bacterium]|nr:hypothetical protein [Chloroflexota bacterium]
MRHSPRPWAGNGYRLLHGRCFRAARLIDRTLRPLFDGHIRNDVQVVITVLSLDDKNDPDIPSLIAASLAILTSNIPWNGPIA